MARARTAGGAAGRGGAARRPRARRPRCAHRPGPRAGRRDGADDAAGPWQRVREPDARRRERLHRRPRPRRAAAADPVRRRPHVPVRHGRRPGAGHPRGRLARNARGPAAGRQVRGRADRGRARGAAAVHDRRPDVRAQAGGLAVVDAGPGRAQAAVRLPRPGRPAPDRPAGDGRSRPRPSAARLWSAYRGASSPRPSARTDALVDADRYVFPRASRQDAGRSPRRDSRCPTRPTRR